MQSIDGDGLRATAGASAIDDGLEIHDAYHGVIADRAGNRVGDGIGEALAGERRAVTREVRGEDDPGFRILLGEPGDDPAQASLEATLGFNDPSG
jgi:hypothetical protein